MIRLVMLRHGESTWNLENRFTGWTDVDLTEQGVREAHQAGRLLREAGYSFDLAHTSVLKRAIRTLWIALDEMDRMWIPVYRSWRLNERHYGALQGLDKSETAARHGAEQVQIWRRSYDVRPPGGECLKDVVENRVRPYYTKTIKPLVDQGKNVLIAAHGNSLRAMLIILGEETPGTINKAEMPTGIPLVFEIEGGKIRKKYFLDNKKAA